MTLTMDDTLNQDGQTEALQAVSDAYLGPAYVGWILNLVLVGVLLSQFYDYQVTAKWTSDSRGTKYILYFVVFLSVVSAGINGWEVYFHGVSQARDANSLYLTSYMDAAPPIIVGLIGALTQTWFARRTARVLTQKKWLQIAFKCAIGVMICVGWVASIGAGIMNVLITQNKVQDAAPFTYNIVAGVWLWLAAATDCVITVCLVITLKRHVHGFSTATDSMIRRIINISMRTAAVTATMGVCGALVATVFPTQNVATTDALFAFTLPLSSLYPLSLLITLSSRREPTGQTKGSASKVYEIAARSETAAGRTRFNHSGIGAVGETSGVEVVRETVTRVEEIVVDFDDTVGDDLEKQSRSTPKAEYTPGQTHSLPALWD